MINNINNINKNNNNSAVKTTLNKFSYNANLSNMPGFLTSGQAKLSDEELESRLMDMARRDAATGKNSRDFTPRGKELRSDEWFKLHQDFVARVSPDRKGIIDDIKPVINLKLNALGFNPNQKNIFDFLKNVTFSNFGEFGNYTIGSNFLEFKDNNGNSIAFFSEHQGWVAMTTNAEAEQSREFNKMWDEALAKAQQELKNPQKQNASNADIIIDIKV